ncbi:MAG: biotin--[acetyl-CoA-carboxylase] ligase [Myxococcota bacterium]|nr:biotin--[acetyl-CoA-carboxylase] ligase [Myxococcota bacterium]
MSQNVFGREAIAQALRREVVFFDAIASTNSEAMRLGNLGAGHGTLVVADAQVGGKGRLGRSWQSPAGLNLYFSLVMRPEVGLDRVALLGLACAVGIAEATDLQIKWPNDLLDRNRRKVAGILSELECEGGAVGHVVLGVGLNVNQVEFPEDLPNAASLCGTQGSLDRVRVLSDVVGSIEQWCHHVEDDPGRVLEQWRVRWADRGREMRVGERVGKAVDVREDGALLLQTQEGIEPVLSGDVLPTRGGP